MQMLSLIVLVMLIIGGETKCVCEKKCPPCPACSSPVQLTVEGNHKRTIRAVTADDPNCNSVELRQLMVENMNGNVTESKRAIMEAAEMAIGGNFNVICARGDFSYVTSTRVFCLQAIDDVTCYAFATILD